MWHGSCCLRPESVAAVRELLSAVRGYRMRAKVRRDVERCESVTLGTVSVDEIIHSNAKARALMH